MSTSEKDADETAETNSSCEQPLSQAEIEQGWCIEIIDGYPVKVLTSEKLKNAFSKPCR